VFYSPDVIARTAPLVALILASPAAALELTAAERVDETHVCFESGLRTDDDVPDKPEVQFARLANDGMKAAGVKVGDPVAVIAGGKAIAGVVEGTRLGKHMQEASFAIEITVKLDGKLPADAARKNGHGPFYLLAPAGAEPRPVKAKIDGKKIILAGKSVPLPDLGADKLKLAAAVELGKGPVVLLEVERKLLRHVAIFRRDGDKWEWTARSLFPAEKK
jgi:hypothetical protein